MKYTPFTQVFWSVLLVGMQTYAFTYHGAGVLPYAIDPKTHKAYFLFSREAYGSAKGYWADFGGKADKKDGNNPEKIAARECSEESNNLFGSYKRHLSYLNSSRGTYKVDTPYALFFAHVAYKKSIDQVFQRKLARAHGSHHKEKDKLIWVPAHSLEWAVQTQSNHVYLPNGKTITLRPHMLGILTKARTFIQKLSRGIVPKGRILAIHYF